VKHEGAHVHLPLQAPLFADDERPVAQDLSFQPAVEADLPVAEIHGADDGDPFADQAQGLPLPAGKPPPQSLLPPFPPARHSAPRNFPST